MRMERHAAIASERNKRLVGPDGVALAVTTYGSAAAPPVLFAHGFGQSRRAWTRAAEGLARAGWRCITYDMRGHGDSDRVAGGGYVLEQFIGDLACVARSAGTPPVLIGASLGGLLGLALAGEVRPAPFRALVLVDITPRWEARGVERMLGFMRAHPDGFADLAAAAAEVAAYLPQRQRAKSRDELAALLHAGPDGRLRWHWDPALMDTIARDGERYQQRLLEAARRIEVPVLLISGGRSDVVSDATVDEFLAAVPHARHVVVPHAAHTLAGDDNTAFTTAVENFLDTLASEPVPAPHTRAAALRGAP